MSPLDPWIIEEIKKQEEKKRRENEIRPELPVPEPLPPQVIEEEEEKKGPIVIDISGDPDDDDTIDGSRSDGTRTFRMYLI